jgi:hypothetical protein
MALAMAGALALFAPGLAGAQVKSPSDLAAELEKSRGVKVLKLKETSVDGRAAYIVTVMNPADTSSSAFQVEQILVDAETGMPLPTYRHGPTGFTPLSGPEFKPVHEGDGQAIRRMTFGGP